MIDAQTELYGIIGNPVRHSLSPILHNGVFRRMEINAVYLALEVKHLKEALSGIKALGLRGVSVTIPFKTEVFSLLDEVDEVSGKIKSVNTIVNKEGNLIGYNTDWQGAMEALEEKVNLKEKKVLLLGAGGSARAIGFGLKEKMSQIIVYNRSQNRAEALAKELGCNHCPLSSVEEMEWDIIVNATSVGMYPHDAESPIPKEVLKKGMVVMDIVYQPLRTRLLQEAEEQGCVTIDGLEMLARQGAAQLEIWIGRRPDLKEIREDLWRALGRVPLTPSLSPAGRGEVADAS
ncbi:MAG: shikimate dehydrogenase [Thermodesulfobacteriota bacterium]|nr:shikimate dehydrogenase [Thermodesulfobacteriota bacterium]